MSFGGDFYMIVDLLKLQNAFNYDIIIETGTEYGSSLRVLKKIFNKVYSCELNPEVYDTVHNNPDFANYCLGDNVEHVFGNSPECLKKWFAEIGHDKFFLYLDAHWHDYWPLQDELQQVIDFGYKPIIIIHDFDVNNPELGYDTYNEIGLDFNYVKDKINQIYGETGYEMIFNTKSEINRGCVYFYPKGIVDIKKKLI